MSLTLKSYFADSVEAALLLARQELGEDAMLVESKRTGAANRALGAYEVVFAREGGSAPAHAAPALTAMPPVAASAGANGLGEVMRELAATRREIEQISSVISRPNALLPPEVLDHPELCRTLAELLRLEISPLLVRELASTLRSRLGADPHLAPGRAGRIVRQILETLVSVDPVVFAGETWPSETGGRRVLAFVGPPGAGKTSSLVKMTTLAAIGARRPTLVLSCDTERIAASEPLRCYAGILGVAFETVDSPEDVRRALDEHRAKDTILLDTPGIGPADRMQESFLAALLGSVRGLETLLVLPATMKPADLTATVDRFLPFHPSRLLFTRMDETRTYGALLNEMVRTQLPVSHLSFGQRIPEDLEPATVARLVELIATPQAAAAHGAVA